MGNFESISNWFYDDPYTKLYNERLEEISNRIDSELIACAKEDFNKEVMDHLIEEFLDQYNNASSSAREHEKNRVLQILNEAYTLNVEEKELTTIIKGYFVKIIMI